MNQAEIISENLKRLLKMRNKKASDMAKATGISTGMISGYMTAKNIPRMGKIQKMADFLGVNITDITDSYKGDTPVEQEKPITYLPVFGEVYNFDNLNDPNNIAEYMVRLSEVVPDGVKFVVHSEETALIPIEADVMISQQSDAKDGEIVAIVEHEGDKPIIRKIKHIDEGFIFYTDSTPPVFVKTEDAHILGVVKRIIMDP